MSPPTMTRKRPNRRLRLRYNGSGRGVAAGTSKDSTISVEPDGLACPTNATASTIAVVNVAILVGEGLSIGCPDSCRNDYLHL